MKGASVEGVVGKVRLWVPKSPILKTPYQIGQNMRMNKESYRQDDFTSSITYQEMLADMDKAYIELMQWIKMVDEKIQLGEQ